MSLRVVVPPHPLIAHWLTMLRASATPAALYATGLEELGRWLTYEAIRDWLPYRKEEVLTENGVTEGTVIQAEIPILAIPILPGGLHLWTGARKVLPNAQLCLEGIPSGITAKEGVIVFADQLANISVLTDFLTKLESQEVEANRIRIITTVTSSPGLSILAKKFPEITIHCACIDPETTVDGEIKPGIGNPILRLNTRTSSSN